MGGVFWLYFYENPFGPQHDSTIINRETLNKNTVQTLLNELFSLSKETNERILKEYIVNKNVELGYCTKKDMFRPKI